MNGMNISANWFVASRALVVVTAEALRCSIIAGGGSSKAINIRFTNYPHHGTEELGRCDVAINHTGPGVPDSTPDKFILRVFAADDVCELHNFGGTSLCGRLFKCSHIARSHLMDSLSLASDSAFTIHTTCKFIS